MADRFYTSEELGPGEHVLSGAEAHHLLAVRRFAPGDRVTLFNGDGNEYPAEVVAAGKKAVTLNVRSVEPADRELPFPLVVASALPKGDRADFLVEKLTELGVTRFVPLLTERSVVRPKDTAVEKFARAVIEASKQCGRNRLMAVDPPRNWAAFLGLPDLPPRRFVLHTGDGLTPLTGGTGGVVVAVGPEGGFSPAEVEAALGAGWRAASLGPRVLRVETAAVAAAALLGVATPQAAAGPGQ
jgi:16S rRNA (uracil1498-N3)-methyltransferase